VASDVRRGFTCGGCGSRVAFTAPGCACGGLLELDPPSGRWAVDDAASGVWRYRARFPFDAGWDGWRSLTMGEGGTPLIRVGRALVKVEYASPTLSFKDRGAALVVARAALAGAEHVLVDSSGNAGTAVAAYAARAGMRCTVVAPAATSPAKLAQVRAHGAELRLVDGTREDVAAAARAEVGAGGAWYASHVADPTFYEGTKTMAFEVFEQLGRLPDVVVLPAGNGTLVLGWARGATELVVAGLVEVAPRIVAVQAAGCAPLAMAWAAGADDIGPISAVPTIAEGIAIARPARGAAVLAAVRASGGSVTSVGEVAIVAARRHLARSGLYVEPTAAATWAGLLQLPAGPDEVVLAPLCGAGLKSPG
jgi:threonine synthase